MDFDKQIDEIKKRLAALGKVRPGSVSKQFNVCGKLGCKCKDKVNPQKHGPYYILSYRYAGKNTTEYVSPEHLRTIHRQLKNYTAMMELVNKWVGVCIQKSKIEMKKTREASN
jgi:hypothetical protein